MKIRTGFVSNSSSMSFVLSKEKISSKEIEKILNHTSFASKKMKRYIKKGLMFLDCGWLLFDTKDWLIGGTIMDNFGMEELFEFLKIDKESYDFDDSHFTNPDLKIPENIVKMSFELQRYDIPKKETHYSENSFCDKCKYIKGELIFQEQDSDGKFYIKKNSACYFERYVKCPYELEKLICSDENL